MQNTGPLGQSLGTPDLKGVALYFALFHRACAEAWAAGGLEGEQKERQMWQTRERRKIQESLDAMTAIRETALKRQQDQELSEKGKHTFF